MVPLSYYLYLTAILFAIGVFGVLIKRNAIIIIMCIELMLNAVNLAFVALSRVDGGRRCNSVAGLVVDALAAPHYLARDAHRIAGGAMSRVRRVRSCAAIASSFRAIAGRRSRTRPCESSSCPIAAAARR